MDELGGLFARAAENQRALAGLQIPGNFFQREQSRCIERSHVAQAQNDHWRQLVHVFGHHGNLVRGAKQKRPVNAKNRRVIGDVFILQDVHAAVFDVVVSDLRNRRSCGDTADEQQRGQNHSRLDCNGKVGEYGERERHQPHADVSPGELEQLRNLAPLAHVVGHNHQDSGQRGHGYVAHQTRGK